MFRQIPVQNKLCFQREHERNVMMHEIKIRGMKKMIDNEAPTQYDFLASRKKKEALQQTRGNEIQRENKILISKLTQIMNRSHFPRSQTEKNLHGSAFSSSQYSSMFPFNQNKNSLNKELRKKEFVKIVIENQALLKRIQGQKSEYDVKSWEKERCKNEKYISQISEYQYKDFKPNKTIVKFGIWNDQSPSGSQMSKRPTAAGKLQPLFKNKNQQKIIYKNGRKIGSYIYLVEIKVQNGYFIINLENLQKQPNQYKIELPAEEGMSILTNECNNDPEVLIERIRIDEKTKSIFFKRNIEYRNKSESMNNLNEQPKYERSRTQSHHKMNNQSPPNGQLRVTEEREEEDEQSILNSKLSQPNTAKHQDQESNKHDQEKDNHNKENTHNNKQNNKENEQNEDKDSDNKYKDENNENEDS